MRFSNTASYVGKGQKDLSDRAASLAALGITITERNVDHPAMLSRTAIVAAEKSMELTWICGDSSKTLKRGHARKTASGWRQITIFTVGGFVAAK